MAATAERRFEVLLRPECLALLSTRTVGRLAVADDDQPPFVVPVNYVLDGDTIVFRTDPGEKLRLLQHHPASFQVDQFDELLREGWTVLVRGTTDRATPAQVERLQLPSWAPGEKAIWVQMRRRASSAAVEFIRCDHGPTTGRTGDLMKNAAVSHDDMPGSRWTIRPC